MTDRLQFDSEKHLYTIDGAPVPSVTQMINAVYPRNYSCGNWYLERGSAMHYAIHFLVQGKLRWESVDHRILGRIRAFEKFMLENQ